MTTNVINELGNRWLPFPVERFFTMQRAPDMWFGDELPPTAQAEMLSPLVTQTKLMVRQQLMQTVMMGQHRATVEAQRHRATVARSRVGKRAKVKRH